MRSLSDRLDPPEPRPGTWCEGDDHEITGEPMRCDWCGIDLCGDCHSRHMEQHAKDWREALSFCECGHQIAVHLNGTGPCHTLAEKCFCLQFKAQGK